MNHKRKRPKAASRAQRALPHGSRMGEAPGHWVRLRMTRPARRRTRRLLAGAAATAEGWDALALPPGNRRPHPYWW